MSGDVSPLPRVYIVEQDGNVFEIRVEGATTEITAITETVLEGETLILRGLHLDGSGPGTSSFQELREAARQLGLQHDARSVIIHGARRTTGANPGHMPRAIVIPVGD